MGDSINSVRQTGSCAVPLLGSFNDGGIGRGWAGYTSVMIGEFKRVGV